MPNDERPRDREPGEWFVYIVECADGTLYTGITTDLERRVEEHNAGTGARYTRARRPVVLRYSERQPDRSQASVREAGIKALSRSEKERLIDRGP
jgi:putative endonuclease